MKMQKTKIQWATWQRYKNTNKQEHKKAVARQTDMQAVIAFETADPVLLAEPAAGLHNSYKWLLTVFIVFPQTHTSE